MLNEFFIQGYTFTGIALVLLFFFHNNSGELYLRLIYLLLSYFLYWFLDISEKGRYYQYLPVVSRLIFQPYPLVIMKPGKLLSIP